MTDLEYMKLAYGLAAKGKGKASPNPMVGAVLVKGNSVVSEGWHRRCGGAHAEIEALKKAGKKACGATLYVTLEPCFHFGRTPPCVGAVVESGVKRVVVGMKDPNPLTAGKSIARLRRSGIEVTCGLLGQELKKFNEVFIKYITQNMPFVVVKTAQTLDGKIATRTGHSQWITSKKSREYGHKLRGDFDAILVGIQTVLKDNPRLNASRVSKKLKKIVLDSSLCVSSNARLFQQVDPSDCIIATTRKANAKKIDRMRRQGVQVIVCPLKEGRVHMKWLMEELAKKKISSVLIEGGGQVIGSALKEKVVDKMFTFIAPKIVGDAQARVSVDGLSPEIVGQCVGLKDIQIKQISQDVLIEGYVKYTYVKGVKSCFVDFDK
ncbi:MAG: bifunctional diaminohydroxyphosphoribosylaminopyrimidine deaminase/5-amino-6-(5-phosphoribosylamino)uracil reductase RibD [Candidatus Omnitrophica bacterium]|nr:bifunctional diaminohydroxyphosphoribosylaminopyrimidine deaminase/5-amino-6-(5-phosphoribosylamino)uracil reductase RibD [Candidatus Omnitrophota bacterium]